MKTTLRIPILLSITRLGKSAYGMAIVDDIKNRYGQDSSVPAIYMTLKRLQTEGLIRSKMGDKTNKRGGRRKQIYSVQGPGRHYLRDYYNSVSDVWHDLEHYLAEHRFI